MEFIADIIAKVAQIAARYNVNFYHFLTIYIASIIPIYGGLFMMLYGLGYKLNIRKVFFLVKGLGIHAISGERRRLFFFGLYSHIFGWLMPYLYLMLVLENVSIFLKIILFIGIVYLGRKVYSQSSLGRDETLKHILVERQLMVRDDLHKILWHLYDGAFRQMNESSPCRQSFHEDDFYRMMSRDDVMKFIVWYRGGIIGLAMITTNLKNSPWISEDFFIKHFGKPYNEKKLCYFMGIALEQRYRRRGIALYTLEKMFEEIPQDNVVGFDHSSGHNPHIGYFPYLLRGKSRIRRVYLDSMKYYVVHMR